jgi:hypothetical protein
MKALIGKCRTCKWFFTNEASETGVCCYNPPVVLMDEEVTYRSERPVTMVTWFCSKWKSEREV